MKETKDIKVIKEKRGGGAPGTRAVSPTACGEDHSEAAVPLQLMEVYRGSDIHPQPKNDPKLEQVDS